MKIRLSTIFLAVLALAISLAWYVDRTSQNRKLQGVWCHQGSFGYSSKLNFLLDGSFTKQQNYRWGSEIFKGNYAVDEEDRLISTLLL